jgi:hypothetical protein
MAPSRGKRMKVRNQTKPVWFIRTVIRIVVVAVLTCSGCRERPQGPSIAFAPYRVDYGTVPENNRAIEAHFPFRNEGTRPLRILKAEGTCKCRVSPSRVPEREILPGESDEIVLWVGLAAREGLQKVEIYVHSNDAQKPVVELHIVARVRPDMVVNTESLDLGQVHVGETASSEFEVRMPETPNLQPSECLQVLAGSPVLSTRLVSTRKLEGQLGQTYVLTYRVDLSTRDALGPVREVLKIQHAATGASREVHVMARVVGDVDVQPERLFMGMLSRDQSVSRTIRIVASAGKPFRVLKVESTSEAFSASLSELEAGTCEVHVASQPAKILDGLIEAQILVSTTDSLQPLIRIPVTAYGRPNGE